jgi:hypothetical protein
MTLYYCHRYFVKWSFKNSLYMFQELYQKMPMMKNLSTLWQWRSASCSLAHLADMFRIKSQAQTDSTVAALKSFKHEMNKSHVILQKNPDTEQLSSLLQMERAQYDIVCFAQQIRCWECVNYNSRVWFWLSLTISDSIYIFHSGRRSVCKATCVIMPQCIVQMKAEDKWTVTWCS